MSRDLVLVRRGGVSPGAALAFLLTGPATNFTTFGVLGNLHGRRIAIVFSVVIVSLSVVLGIMVNAFFPAVATTIPGLLHHHEEAGLLQLLSLGLLAGVYLFSFLHRGPREFGGQIFRFNVEGDEEYEVAH